MRGAPILSGSGQLMLGPCRFAADCERRAPFRRHARGAPRRLGRHAQRDEEHLPPTRDARFQGDDDIPRRQRELAEAFRDQPRHVIEAARPRPSARPLEVTIHE
jgi:hypothetical protein